MQNNTLLKKWGRIISLLMVAVICIAILIACSGCTVTTPPPSGDTDITDTGNENDPDKDKPNEKPNDDTPTPKYCDLVMDILNDEEINSLIASVKKDNALFIKSAYFDPHPYAFLQKQGHDISAIKSGELECHTLPYTTEDEPNALHMLINVENNVPIRKDYPHYTAYHLKYTLSNKEMSDYKTLHKDMYIQAVFLNDKISAKKTANIISKFEIVAEINESISSYLTYYKIFGVSKCNVIVKGYVEDDDTGTISVLTYDNGSPVSSFSCSGSLTECELSSDTFYMIDEKVLFNYISGNYTMSPSVTEVISNIKKITKYFPQNSLINGIKFLELNK